jgi:hypothetical protein
MLELPDKSPAVWNKFFKENKFLVYRYILKQVKTAIEKDLPKIELFKFKDSGKINMLYEKDYVFALEEALKTFVQMEEYERANQAKKLIDSYHINLLIKESNEV